jgi:hypothetical protein
MQPIARHVLVVVQLLCRVQSETIIESLLGGTMREQDASIFCYVVSQWLGAAVWVRIANVGAALHT